MDYYMYNSGCSTLNHFSTTFPTNYGIPQGFSRHTGYEEHVYGPRSNVRQNLSQDYAPYSQMIQLMGFQPDNHSQENFTCSDIVNNSLVYKVDGLDSRKLASDDDNCQRNSESAPAENKEQQGTCDHQLPFLLDTFFN